MGGHVAKKSPHVKYEAQLTRLEKRLATAAGPDAFAELAHEFHMVGYSLGHDIPAIIANPEIVSRAGHGHVVARERAAEAFVRERNLKHAMFHLFEALEGRRTLADLVRVGERIGMLLDPIAPAAAAQLRAGLEVLTDADVARDAFAGVVRTVKHALDWDALPAGTS